MKLLVFGKTGQVARELARRCPESVLLRFVGRQEADLSDPEACARIVAEADVEVVMNAAAWTAVDAAEADEGSATIVNGEAPGAMASACAARGVPIIHLSTDYVFDGEGELPFPPDHPTAPLGAYGRSKLAGEYAVRVSGARHIILRTSWVVSMHSNNFVKTMLRLGRERDVLQVVADQIGGPTPAAAIADAIFAAARALVAGALGGTYHFSGAPNVSWADFARTIMALGQLDCVIEDIETDQYPMPARRPRNSRLDCSTLVRDLGIARPDWRISLADILKDLDA